MLLAQSYPPTIPAQATSTLASLSAESQSTSNSPLLSPKVWISPYSLEPGTSKFSPCQFQSNGMPEVHWEADIAMATLAGLGIHLPCYSQETKSSEIRLSLSPSLIPKSRNGSCVDSRNPRTPRLESAYTLDCEEKISGYGDMISLNPPWTFSSMIKAAELALESPLTVGTNMTAETAHPTESNDSSMGSFEDFSFEALSAATGISVEELAAQFTAGAQYALRHLSDDDTSVIKHSSDTVEASYMTPEMRAPIADINMFTMTNAWLLPSIGINPADVMPPPPLLSPVLVDPLNRGLSLPDTLMDMDLKETVINWQQDILLVASQDESSTMKLEVDGESLRDLRLNRIGEDSGRLSDYELPPFLSSPSSDYAPSFSLSRRHNSRSTRIRKRKISVCETMDLNALETIESSMDSQIDLPPIDLGTPVFDAHRGIDLQDLKARAERYRLRNHGRDYDKRWLLSFAGKLSAQGELVEEFKCYVTGCQQTNKRRDHILIHVGGHLDQRPFKCPHCPARFLRKNECKRHELSHSGLRPFTCQLCLFPGTTFVRQDLLRRHMKRTHQIDDSKENKPTSQPRKRVRKH